MVVLGVLRGVDNSLVSVLTAASVVAALPDQRGVARSFLHLCVNSSRSFVVSGGQEAAVEEVDPLMVVFAEGDLG